MRSTTFTQLACLRFLSCHNKHHKTCTACLYAVYIRRKACVHFVYYLYYSPCARRALQLWRINRHAFYWCSTMFKESLKSSVFTDGFRLSDLLCQSYPPHVWSWTLQLSPEKSDPERPSVRPPMCARSPLGLPHTQNRMSGSPRVAEILLIGICNYVDHNDSKNRNR
jgi:hypothetical protein